MKLFFIIAMVAFLVLCWKTYKMSRGAYESHEQNYYADLAALQSLVTQQGRQIKDLQIDLQPGMSKLEDPVKDSMSCRVRSRSCQMQVKESTLD